MGLDTSHNCWHGAYSGFASWRLDVAHTIGWGTEATALGSATYAIPEGRVPEQDPPADEEYTVDGETHTVEWSKAYDNGVWLGQWDNDPEDVIDVLMIHSDCEGIIPHRFCQPLAERLAEIAGDQNGWERDATVRFINGLLIAHGRGDDVDFH